MVWYGTIDRFEGSKAVILPESIDSTLSIDRALLPENCRVGDRIQFNLKIEHDVKENRKKHIQDLIDKLSQE